MRLRRNRFRPQFDVLSSRIAPSGISAGYTMMPGDAAVGPASESALGSAGDPMDPEIPGNDQYNEATPMPPLTGFP